MTRKGSNGKDLTPEEESFLDSLHVEHLPTTPDDLYRFLGIEGPIKYAELIRLAAREAGIEGDLIDEHVRMYFVQTLEVATAFTEAINLIIAGKVLSDAVRTALADLN